MQGINIPEGREAAVRLKFSGDVGPRAGVDGGELVVDNDDVVDARMEGGHVIVRAKKPGQTIVRYRVEHPEDDSGDRDLECVLNVTVAAEDDEAATWPTGVEFDASDAHFNEPKGRRGKTPRQKRREEAEKAEADAAREAEERQERRRVPRKPEEQPEGEAKMPGAIDQGGKKDVPETGHTGLGSHEDPGTERAAGAANLEGEKPLDPKGELEQSQVATAGAGAPRGGRPLPGSGEPVPSGERIRNPAAQSPQQPGPQPRDKK